MLRIILLIITLVSFQKIAQCQIMNNFTKEWIAIETDLSKGKSTDALKKTEQLFSKANSEQNAPHIIRAAMHLVGLNKILREEAELNNYWFLDSLAVKTKGVAKNILQSMQAEYLKGYLDNNRWRFYNRTQLTDDESSDIQTWSIEKLTKVIAQHYTKSLANEEELQKTSTDKFDVIILKGVNTENLRPTIYDLLAFRAIDFFSSDERNITKPAYYFEINQPEAFADVSKFVNFKFVTNDTESLHFQALKLYQQLLKFRLKSNQTDALLDADLSRLEFVKNYSTHPDADNLFKQSLEKFVLQNGISSPKAAYAKYLLIKSNIANVNTDTRPTVYANSIEALKEIKAKYKNEKAGIEAKHLLNQILATELNLNVEQVNLPNLPFLAKVSFQNIEAIYVKIVPISKSLAQDLQSSEAENVKKKIINSASTNNYNISLPKTNDYNNHSVEIKIDAQKVGLYAVIVSSTSNFDLKKNNISIAIVNVSNIGVINAAQSSFRRVVVNRNTGQPLADATVKAYALEYNNEREQSISKLIYTLKTDKNGFVDLPKSTGNNHGYQIDISYENDQLIILGNQYIYEYGEGSENTNTSYLFTDRKIYRPGQTVYFKGITVIQKTYSDEPKLVTNNKTQVQLLDANWQVVSRLALTTNDYGSYSGVFVLPATGLTGNFQIKDSANNSIVNFSVEEYKRPKFRVDIVKPKNNFKLNDSIEMKATAKAYAGNNIDGAKVTYTVNRTISYPFWCYDYNFRGGFYPTGNSGNVLIAKGEATTNEKGEVLIKFKAIADAKADRKFQPSFNYSVSVDITDQNGETRSATESIVISYQSIDINISSIDKLMAHNVQKIKINSTNTLGDFTPAKVHLLIKKLSAPKQYIRNRYWEKPDFNLYTKTAFKQWFPMDEFENETNKSYWPATEIYNTTFTTDEKAAHPLKNLTLTAGHYLVEAYTIDVSGDTVRTMNFVELYGESKDYFSDNIFIAVDKNSYAPGDTASFEIVTDFKDIYLLQALNKTKQKDPFYNVSMVNNGQLINTIITPQDKGGVGLSAAFAKYNRFFDASNIANVPWSDKELNISFGTFRDKTLPGSNEAFTLTIKGANSTKVAAEILATMYDESLDQLTQHTNEISLPNLFPTVSESSWFTNNFESISGINNYLSSYDYDYFEERYDKIGVNIIDKKKRKKKSYQPLWWVNPLEYAYDALEKRQARMATSGVAGAAPTEAMRISGDMEKVSTTVVKAEGGLKSILTSQLTANVPPANETPKPTPSVQVRKNFNETAFFLPQLETNANGDIIIKYTIPEALTSWKLQTLAHTKDLAIGYATKTVVTQKPLMVQPNIPRFLREGDVIDIAVKIANVSDKEITGQCALTLINPETNESVDGWFKNMIPNQYFTAAAGMSQTVSFPLEIPYGYNKPVIIRATAIEQSTNTSAFTDAEENIVPVVTNRMLVTETLPIYINGGGTKTYNFAKLKNNTSESLQHHALTVEYSPNPIWYAIQALPYLMEYPYDCAEQTFSKFYANSLATSIANSSPKIKNIFDQWAKEGAALKSNLEKNQELKTALLEETPWVIDAKNEAQQKKNIALLFDLVRMSNEQEKAMKKLEEMQKSTGGFSWFKGGNEDTYITQYIATGMGRLQKLGVLKPNVAIEKMLLKSVSYVDSKIVIQYNKLDKKIKKDANSWINLSNEIYYLYMRSFYATLQMNADVKKAHDFYLDIAKTNWLKQSRYIQALTAIVAYRNNDQNLAKTIIESLKQNAIVNEELGMYWKDVNSGYYWYQNPVETVSTIIEAFNEITNDQESVGLMQKWLLKNKQTTNWKTTKATAEACYALLINGVGKSNELVVAENKATITVGKVSFSSNEASEAGTGYFKKRIEGEMVKSEMASISITVDASQKAAPSFGAVYWQYFEALDKITPAKTPLKLDKKIFKEITTDKGKQLVVIKENDALKVGDKMIIRIELRSDRDMEYLHLKDMRSSGVEPVNVLSSYKWQGGLGYYESTKDISSNFFISYLPKGTYVFEYPVFVAQKGVFSNGVTSIQCMYAPEFSSHSEGVKVRVE